MRPPIAPAAVAALVDAAPARLVRKLDATPTLAEGWTWATDGELTRVTTDSGETVTVDGAGLRCSCLLSPRCLHVLAVARALPLEDPTPEVSSRSTRDPDIPHRSQIGTPGKLGLEGGQREAAASAFRALATALDAGLDALGALREAEVLRAVHACRAAGLHRLSSAGVRIVRAARALRDGSPSASLAEISDDVVELLACATALAREGNVDAAWVGTARRAYHPLGSLRVHGLCCEAIATRSGYAGVVTHLCDDVGRLFTVSDVQPGAATRAPAAYEAGVGIGDATLSHRELSREGLFLSAATASHDGRLGAGQDVRAVRAGLSPWTATGPAALFATSFAAQLDRARAALVLPFADRPAGADLLFCDARVIGVDGGALWLATGSEAAPHLLRCVAPTDSPLLTHRESLRALGRGPGLALRIIARLDLDTPHTVALLGIGVTDEARAATTPRLHLPAAWHGRANLGLDALSPSHVELGSTPPPSPPVPSATEAPRDPLDALRRRLRRVVLGGRATLSPETSRAVESDARHAEASLMPTAATVLRELATVARTAERATTGARRRADAEQLAHAFLRAAQYERHARAELARRRWG